MPQTLKEFAARSDAIVCGRVIDVADVSDPRTRTARTEYEVRVTKTVKEHPNLGTRATVCRPIGKIEYDDRVVKQYEPHFPEFSVGAEYLLFLTWDARGGGCFAPAFGPLSTAEIDSKGAVHPFVSHPLFAGLTGRGKEEVLNKIAIAMGK